MVSHEMGITIVITGSSVVAVFCQGLHQFEAVASTDAHEHIWQIRIAEGDYCSTSLWALDKSNPVV